ncbi:hypothetical protein [Virgisporangium aliadipatigenens]|nr:hypothetical protein [Virgisporangium aliadipatigenens]
MAARSWLGSTITAIGVAAGAGAAQLGVGYGLGIVVWLPADHQHSQIALLSSLAWVVWIAANSTVLGAVTANWLAGFGAGPDRSGFLLASFRATLAFGAAVGAVVVAPLAAVQAHAVQAREMSRTAQIPPDELVVSGDEWTVAGYAVLGVLVGLVIALAALSSRSVSANVVASAAYLWVLGLVAIIDALRDGTEPVLAQLAFWKFNGGPMVRDFYVPGVLVMLSSAFLIGILSSWRAGRRGDGRVGVATSGAVGPLLVAAAYLLAAPKLTGSGDVDLGQWSAYLFAPYAVIAGLAGSVLVAALGPRGGRSWFARRPKPVGTEADPVESDPFAEPKPKPAVDTTAAEPIAGKEPKDEAPAAKRSGLFRSRSSRAAKPEKTETPAASSPDDDLDDWASELSGKTPAPVAAGSKAKGRAAVKDKDADASLEEDAYAPSRAYPGTDPNASAYATDTVEQPKAEPAKATPAKATGTATPLWPTQKDADGEADKSDDDEPPTTRGRRGRRR